MAQPQPWACPKDSWKSLALPKVAEYTQDKDAEVVGSVLDDLQVNASVLDQMYPFPPLLSHFGVPWSTHHHALSRVTAVYNYSLFLHCLDWSDIWLWVSEKNTASNNLGPNFAKFPLSWMKANCMSEDLQDWSSMIQQCKKSTCLQSLIVSQRPAKLHLAIHLVNSLPCCIIWAIASSVCPEGGS